ncbi:hypothetical protein [Streptomyces violaceusniger]|uniref:Uncharacterized protein n=1 Tax=Streptomyces violaceusniger (strain Tu 4113) TaxID=653045 RepID=G2PHH8_STRV4|nr:hypothetical protein [Streptomyces violaceusniger]AEM88981.1 hypothetical protein Strvi_0208 [Streptomyces violaceusniger Tu 4113]
MTRTTYRGRVIKILAARGKPGHVRTFINDKPVSHAWQGTEQQAIEWFQQIIDKIENSGGAGMVAMLIPSQYTGPHWYEPGTVDINPNHHATQPGGICLCTLCVIDDLTGGKARYAPLQPDACRHCHQIADGHKNDYGVLRPHPYTEPTEQQRTGRQAA